MEQITLIVERAQLLREQSAVLVVYKVLLMMRIGLDYGWYQTQTVEVDLIIPLSVSLFDYLLQYIDTLLLYELLLETVVLADH